MLLVYLKMFYHKNIDFGCYLGDGVNKIMNGKIINLGNNHPITIRDFISTLERAIKQKAAVEKCPKQPGDVEKTWANVVKANELLGWTPKVELLGGLKKYLEWLKNRK